MSSKKTPPGDKPVSSKALALLGASPTMVSRKKPSPTTPRRQAHKDADLSKALRILGGSRATTSSAVQGSSTSRKSASGYSKIVIPVLNEAVDRTEEHPFLVNLLYGPLPSDTNVISNADFGRSGVRNALTNDTVHTVRSHRTNCKKKDMLWLCTVVARASFLRVLDLSHSNFSLGKDLYHALVSNHSITAIDLSDTKVTLSHLSKYIVPALEANLTLLSVKLFGDPSQGEFICAEEKAAAAFGTPFAFGKMARSIQLRVNELVRQNRDYRLALHEGASTLAIRNRGWTQIPQALLSESVGCPDSMTSLTSLTLCRHRLGSIPNSIAAMRSLTHLDVSRNRLQSLPVTLSDLSLVTLRASRNALEILDAELFSCALVTSLTELEVSHNGITEFPASMALASNLCSLKCHDNKLLSLPTSLPDLGKLSVLQVHDNPLPSIPASVIQAGKDAIIQHLKSLQGQRSVWGLAKLVLVGREGVGKTHLSHALSGTVYDRNISTDGIDLGIWEMEGHIATEREGAHRVPRIRIRDTLPGTASSRRASLGISAPALSTNGLLNVPTADTSRRHSVSSILSRSRGAPLGGSIDDLSPPFAAWQGRASSEDSNWRLSSSMNVPKLASHSEERTIMRVFDFGGQQLYCGSHHFFLSCRATYLIVFDLTDPKFDDRVLYWIKTLDTVVQGFPRPSVILVGTHLDDPLCTQEYLDGISTKLAQLQSISASLSISEIVPVSSSEGWGLERLWDVILTSLAPIAGDRVPTYYRKLAFTLLQNRDCPIMSWERYKDLAVQCGAPATKSALDDMTTFLHDAGVLLHFRANRALHNVVFVDIQWLADRMSDLISFKHNWNGGVVPLSFIDIIWKNYTPSERALLVQVLQTFELVYEGRSEGGVEAVFIPTLLPTNPNKDLNELRRGPVKNVLSSALRASLAISLSSVGVGVLSPRSAPQELLMRRWVFDFVPWGFFARLLVRLVHHSDVMVQQVWRSGICFFVMGHSQPAYVMVEGHAGGLTDPFVLTARLWLIEVDSLTPELQVAWRQDAAAQASSPRQWITGKGMFPITPLTEAVEALITGYYGRDTYLGEEGGSLARPIERFVACPRCCRDAGTEEPACYWPYEACVAAHMRGEALLCRVHGGVQVADAAPDVAMSHLLLDPADVAVGKVLGRGGFGVVRKASLRLSGAPCPGQAERMDVAVKQLLMRDRVSGAMFREFQHEIVMLAQVAHPSITRLLGLVYMQGEQGDTRAGANVGRGDDGDEGAGVHSGEDNEGEGEGQYGDDVDGGKGEHEGAHARGGSGVEIGTGGGDGREGTTHSQTPAHAATEEPVIGGSVNDTSINRSIAMVMEYCPLPDLYVHLHDQSMLPDSRFPWLLRLRICIELAQGIHVLHMHSPPIIHRDIRSPNVFVSSLDPDSAQHVKLGDFGLAQYVTQQLTEHLDTWQWLAPEVIRGSGYDESADVYSFGMVVWEVLSRRDPFSEYSQFLITMNEWVEYDEHGVAHTVTGKRQEWRSQAIKTAITEKGLRPSLKAPMVPEDTPPAVLDMVQRCFSDNPLDRPSIDDCITILMSGMLERDPNASVLVPDTPSHRNRTATHVSSQGSNQSCVIVAEEQRSDLDTQGSRVTAMCVQGKTLFIGLFSGKVMVCRPPTYDKVNQTLSCATCPITAILFDGHYVWAAAKDGAVTAYGRRHKRWKKRLSTTLGVECSHVTCFSRIKSLGVIVAGDSLGDVSFWERAASGDKMVLLARTSLCPDPTEVANSTLAMVTCVCVYDPSLVSAAAVVSIGGSIGGSKGSAADAMVFIAYQETVFVYSWEGKRIGGAWGPSDSSSIVTHMSLSQRKEGGKTAQLWVVTLDGCVSQWSVEPNVHWGMNRSGLVRIRQPAATLLAHAFGASSGLAWVAHSEDRTVTLVDASTTAVVRTLSVRARLVAMAYISSQNCIISISDVGNVQVWSVVMD